VTMPKNGGTGATTFEITCVGTARGSGARAGMIRHAASESPAAPGKPVGQGPDRPVDAGALMAATR
jgi:hypothetical protein